MYVRRSEIMMVPGMAADANAWLAQYDAFLKTRKGFQELLFLRSLGYPTKRVGLQRWESQDVNLAHVVSPEVKAFWQANPIEGLFTATGLNRAYAVIHEVGNLDQARVIALLDYTMKAFGSSWRNFADDRKEYLDYRLKYHKEFVGGRVLRFLGDSRRMLLMQGFSDRDMLLLQSLVNKPEYQEFTRTHPLGEYIREAPDFEWYEIDIYSKVT